ncbi:MAG: hypothetical protein KDD64_08365, partial [Bdellovibrionales bacterium]|nr:hypothetical protein [Bdellovibrionales bacterium]
MPIDKKLLAILCCPESKQPLQLADNTLVEQLNKKIRDKSLENVSHQPVTEKIESGLIREDGKILYPV